MGEKTSDSTASPIRWLTNFFKTNTEKAKKLANKRKDLMTVATASFKEQSKINEELINRLSDIHKIDDQIQCKIDKIDKKIKNIWFDFFHKKKDLESALNHLKSSQVMDFNTQLQWFSKIEKETSLFKEIKELGYNNPQKIVDTALVFRNLIKNNPIRLQNFDKALLNFIAQQPNTGEYLDIMPKNPLENLHLQFPEDPIFMVFMKLQNERNANNEKSELNKLKAVFILKASIGEDLQGIDLTKIMKDLPKDIAQTYDNLNPETKMKNYLDLRSILPKEIKADFDQKFFDLIMDESEADLFLEPILKLEKERLANSILENNKINKALNELHTKMRVYLDQEGLSRDLKGIKKLLQSEQKANIEKLIGDSFVTILKEFNHLLLEGDLKSVFDAIDLKSKDFPCVNFLLSRLIKPVLYSPELFSVTKARSYLEQVIGTLFTKFSQAYVAKFSLIYAKKIGIQIESEYHFFNDILEKAFNVASEAAAQMGGTYDERIACCDYAYSNADTGILGVFDACGHNNKVFHDEQVPIFKNFFERLSSDLPNKQFSSIEEAQKFLNSHFKKTAPNFVAFRRKYADIDPHYGGPALFAGFVTTINNQLYFIGGQLVDSCLCYRTKDGNVKFYPPQSSMDGLGDSFSSYNPLGTLPKSIIFPVEEDSELFAFSDGIGEYVSEEEFIAVINKNKDRQKLLDDFHQAITIDLKKDSGHTSNPFIAQLPATKKKNPFFCKEHDGQNRVLNDDISIACLKIKVLD